MKPRPYSTLRGGRIVWVVPEVNTLGPRMRSRPETDDEVRKRLMAAGRWHYPALKGKQLDAQLEYWGMEPRKLVDEPA